MTGRIGPVRRFRAGAVVLCFLLASASWGCFGSRRADVPPPSPVSTAPPDNTAVPIAPVVPAAETPASPEKGETAAPVASAATPSAAAPLPAAKASLPAAPPPAAPQGPAPSPAAPAVSRPVPAPPAAPPSASNTAAMPGHAAPPPASGGAASQAESGRLEGPTAGPAWSRGTESLPFRVDFLGITMGYARFQYRGKVTVDGRPAYHVNVRAWTSGILSYVYPINETIEYYLDAETVTPIRIEYTGRKNKRDDVAFYDQENGRIVYRYRDNGQVRKTVTVPPATHDPVTAVYYFRWKDMDREDKAQNVYGGRKVYRISARRAGTERLRTGLGEFDTLVIEPVIRRDGRLENKGDLRMWVTDDERRVPVRIYGKFRKIREWTLVGELMPERSGG